MLWKNRFKIFKIGIEYMGPTRLWKHQMVSLRLFLPSWCKLVVCRINRRVFTTQGGVQFLFLFNFFFTYNQNHYFVNCFCCIFLSRAMIKKNWRNLCQKWINLLTRYCLVLTFFFVIFNELENYIKFKPVILMIWVSIFRHLIKLMKTLDWR